MARTINFFDGAQSSSTPTIGNIVASDLIRYVNDAAYEAGESGAPAGGNMYYNTTTDAIRMYDEGEAAWKDIVEADVTALSVTYDNSGSGLAATDAQAAIDEVEARVDTNDAKVSADGSITTHSDVGGAAPNNNEILKYVAANNRYEPAVDAGASFPLQGPNGSNSAPTYSFSGDTDSGMYKNGTTSLRWSHGSTAAMEMTATSLRPITAGNMDLGGLSNRWNKLFVNSIGLNQSGTEYGTIGRVNTPSGTLSATFIGEALPAALITCSNNDADANPTDDVFIESGNKTAGTGDSGDIITQTGTSAGGTRGKIIKKDGSEGTTGHVWTSTDTSGTGEWQATAGGGGNDIELVLLDNTDTPYTVLSSNELMVCDTSSGVVQVDLPVVADDRVIRIKKSTGDFTGVAVNPNGADTIGGAINTTLNTLDEYIVLVGDATNSNWIIVERKTKTARVSYTPILVGFGSTTDVSFMWHRDGEDLIVEGTFEVGTPTAVVPTIAYPSGLDHDTAKFPGPNRYELGQAYRGISTANTLVPASNRGLNPLSDRSGTTDSLYLAISVDLDQIATGTFFNEANASSMGMTNTGLMVRMRVPINGWKV